MAFVQNRPEAEAQDIFQRIRSSSYDDVFMLLRAIKDGAMNMQQPPSAMTAMNVPGLPTAASGVDQRLPPIHAIFDHPRRPSPPAHLVHNHSLSSEDSTGSMPSELATNMSTPVPGAGPPPVHRAPLNTLEPSLQQHPHGYMRGTPATLSSEESTSSVLSTSLDGPPKYFCTSTSNFVAQLTILAVFLHLKKDPLQALIRPRTNASHTTSTDSTCLASMEDLTTTKAAVTRTLQMQYSTRAFQSSYFPSSSSKGSNDHLTWKRSFRPSFAL